MFDYILYVMFNHIPSFMSFVHISRFHFRTTLSLSMIYIYIYIYNYIYIYMFIYRISEHGDNISQLNHWGSFFSVFKLGHRNQRFLLDYGFTLGGENPLGDEEKELASWSWGLGWSQHREPGFLSLVPIWFPAPMNRRVLSLYPKNGGSD